MKMLQVALFIQTRTDADAREGGAPASKTGADAVIAKGEGAPARAPTARTRRILWPDGDQARSRTVTLVVINCNGPNDARKPAKNASVAAPMVFEKCMKAFHIDIGVGTGESVINLVSEPTWKVKPPAGPSKSSPMKLVPNFKSAKATQSKGSATGGSAIIWGGVDLEEVPQDEDNDAPIGTLRRVIYGSECVDRILDPLRRLPDSWKANGSMQTRSGEQFTGD